MNLSRLILSLEIDRFKGDLETKIKEVTCHSQQVTLNSLFVCLRGEKFDGHNFVKEAVEKGAKVIVSEEVVEVPSFVTLIKVPDTRLALAQIADNYYNCPSKDLKIIGITGTNGKTTTAYLVESIFKVAGAKIGRLSTISYQIGSGKEEKANFTTPPSLALQSYFQEMVNNGLTYCVMEVSSHALSLSRVEGVNFQSAVFTNITQDHLDFHQSFSAYLNSKIKLFKQLGSDQEKVAIINVDDQCCHKILAETKSKVMKYGLSNQALILAKEVKIDKEGYPSFSLNGQRINLRLIGQYNVYNALAAAAVALHNEVSLPQIKEGLEALTNVCGRFEVVYQGSFKVIVDFAHTPDALHWSLSTAKTLKPKQLITVFGCGGDRDKEKRPMMGKIASLLSDYTIITSDNPRREDPMEIALNIKKGFLNGDSNFEIILERRKAIAKAIALAKEGDLILIAGKGHEEDQILKDQTIHFKDHEVVKEEILSQKKR
ncbi:MAG: UDP-N-acetylmuramoyl-L-alanyl-D-glutamate--2,6-diaminopimelate ligase [bacterium]